MGGLRCFGILLALFIFFASFSEAKAFSCSSNGTGGGNFNLATTWTGCNSTTPQTTDSITVNNGDTVTLVATTTVTGITINNGGVLAANTRAVVNTDGYTNNGSQTGTTSTMTLSGPSGSIITGTGSYSPTGIVTISVGDKTVASGSQLRFDKITITGVTLTNNSTAGLSVTTTLAGTGGLTQGASSILNIGGTSAITTLTATASSNEVHYISTTAAQTVHANTYYHLFIDKSTKIGTLAGATTINGNLSVTAGTLADGGFQITGNATGNFTLAAGTTLTLGTTTTATNFPTAFVTANVSLSASSTVNYNSNLSQTISNVQSYGNLTTTATAAVTKTAAGALTVNGLFTNGANNTFADGGATITLKDGAVMAGTHTGVGKILFSGGSATHSVSGAGSFNNVELNDSNGVLLSGTTNIGGILTITSGTWDTDAVSTAVTGTTTINGTLLVSSTTGTKTFGDMTIATGGTLNFTAAETLAENGNLTINNGGTMSFSAAGIINLTGDLTVNGTGVITGNTGLWTFQKVGGGTIGGTTTSLTIAGNVTFATQYGISFPLTVNSLTVNTGVTETNNSTITSNGTLGGTGTFTQSAGAVLNTQSITITTLNATVVGNTVHLIGGVAGTIKGTSYVDLDINKTTGFNANASGTVNVAGNLTVTSGTINFSSSTFTVTGTTDIFDTLTDSSGGVGGGNNVFGGLVTLHSGSHWAGVIGEVADFHFGNGLVENATTFVSSNGIYFFESNNQSITGTPSFTIDSISVTGIQLTNSSLGTLTSRVSLSGTGTFIQHAGAVLNVVGTNTINTFDASATGNTVNYSGAISQTIKGATYDTLNVGANTSNAVDLSADTIVNTLLTLGDTKVTTSVNKITLGTAAIYSRTNGYVVGTMGKTFSAGATFIYPIGDSTNYTPVDLTMNAVINSSTVDASTVGTDHPDTTAGTSGIDAMKSVNRYFTLTNNGLTFGSYDAVFHFVSGDVDSGASTADMTVAKKTAGAWTTLTATCTTTSCTTTGLTSMSEFQIGVRTQSSSSESSSSGSSSSTSSTSTSSTSTSTPASPIVSALRFIQNVLAPSPTANPEPSPLLDIISSPLFTSTGSATLFLVTGFTFLVGILIGILILVALHRRRKQYIPRTYRKRQI